MGTGGTAGLRSLIAASWRGARSQVLPRLRRLAAHALAGARGRPADGAPGTPRPWRKLLPQAGLTVLLAGVVAVVVGVPNASVEGSLGPHRATYSVVTDHRITVDIGPLGALVLDSPVPWPLGVEVRVREIPVGLSVTGETAVGSLANDLDGYLTFFTQPDVAVRGAVRDLISDAVGRVVLVWSALLVLAAAARLAAGRGALRFEVRRVLARPGVALLVVAVALTPLSWALRDWMRAPSPEARPVPVLAGTALAEARIVGRVGDLLNTYGRYALDAIERNREFYARAAANLAAAYEADPQPGSTSGEPLVKTLGSEDATGDRAGAAVGGTAEDVDEMGEDLDETDASGGQATSAPNEQSRPQPAPEDLVTFLLVSDLHCNVGMAGVVGEAAALWEVDAVVNAGDTVISGTSVEQFCVDALAEAVPDGVPIVVADGNHDSAETADQERRAGMTVLDGDPVEVAGVRFLGTGEPVVTTVTEGVRRRVGESRSEVSLALAERACEAQEAGEPIEILLLHNPRTGVAPMASGCVGLQLSGHFHREVGPTHQGLGVLYVLGSTAGATEGKSSIGPLQSPAVMAVLRYDTAENRAVDYRLVTVGTDASVTLGRWLPFPLPPVALVTAQLDLPEPS